MQVMIPILTQNVNGMYADDANLFASFLVNLVKTGAGRELRPSMAAKTAANLRPWRPPA